MKEKITQLIDPIKKKFLPLWNKYIKNLDPILVTFIAFALIFVLDLIALRYLTNTGIVIACILLVVESVLAVVLSHSNYGILGGVAIAEFIVAIFAKKIPVVLLCLIIYFLTLVVIRVMRVKGGNKK